MNRNLFHKVFRDVESWDYAIVYLLAVPVYPRGQGPARAEHRAAILGTLLESNTFEESNLSECMYPKKWS